MQIAAGVFQPIKDYSSNLKGLVAEMLAVRWVKGSGFRVQGLGSRVAPSALHTSSSDFNRTSLASTQRAWYGFGMQLMHLQQW